MDSIREECVICNTNLADCWANPCHHTICSICIQRLYKHNVSTHCWICRSLIDNFARIGTDDDILHIPEHTEASSLVNDDDTLDEYLDHHIFTSIGPDDDILHIPEHTETSSLTNDVDTLDVYLDHHILEQIWNNERVSLVVPLLILVGIIQSAVAIAVTNNNVCNYEKKSNIISILSQLCCLVSSIVIFIISDILRKNCLHSINKLLFFISRIFFIGLWIFLLSEIIRISLTQKIPENAYCIATICGLSLSNVVMICVTLYIIRKSYINEHQ